jgi:hypothetical protein
MEMDKNKRNQSIFRNTMLMLLFTRKHQQWSNGQFFFFLSSIAGLDLSMYKNVTLQQEVDLIGFQIGLYHCIDVG